MFWKRKVRSLRQRLPSVFAGCCFSVLLTVALASPASAEFERCSLTSTTMVDGRFETVPVEDGGSTSLGTSAWTPFGGTSIIVSSAELRLSCPFVPPRFDLSMPVLSISPEAGAEVEGPSSGCSAPGDTETWCYVFRLRLPYKTGGYSTATIDEGYFGNGSRTFRLIDPPPPETPVAPVSVKGQTAVTAFEKAAFTDYEIAAVRTSARASAVAVAPRKTATGSCLPDFTSWKVLKVKCSVKMSKGRWRVSVTPKINDVKGKPAVRSVRVR